jgi:hypothetical protein
MTERERKHLHTILDRQDLALGALREASRAFDQAVEGMHAALAGMSTANRAQGDAIEGLQAANRAAIELLNSNGKP